MTEDSIILHKALEKSYLTNEQIKACWELYKTRKKSGTEISISEILVGEGYLSQQQIATLKLEASKHLEKQNKIQKRYVTQSLLGKGGMGKVYKCFDTKLNRVVAMKVMRDDDFTQQQLKRFFNEAEILASLSHPNIVQVYDVGKKENQPFFVMEYVKGVTLSEKIHKKVTSLSNIVHWFEDVAKAVEYLHTKKVLHRDLKPSNILIEDTGVVKVMDFGLAKSTYHKKNLTRDGNILGTVGYMPPEQFNGDNNEIDERSDVYALGVVLYEALTGQLPFKGETPMNIFMQQMRYTPVVPSFWNDKIVQDLDTICLKALEYEPINRYQTMADFLEDLQCFQTGIPIKAKPVSKYERVWRKIKKNKAISFSTAIASITLFVVILSFVYQKKDINPEIVTKLMAESHIEDIGEDIFQLFKNAKLENQKWWAKEFFSSAEEYYTQMQYEKALGYDTACLKTHFKIPEYQLAELQVQVCVCRLNKYSFTKTNSVISQYLDTENEDILVRSYQLLLSKALEENLYDNIKFLWNKIHSSKLTNHKEIEDFLFKSFQKKEFIHFIVNEKDDNFIHGILNFLSQRKSLIQLLTQKALQQKKDGDYIPAEDYFFILSQLGQNKQYLQMNLYICQYYQGKNLGEIQAALEKLIEKTTKKEHLIEMTVILMQIAFKNKQLKKVQYYYDSLYQKNIGRWGQMDIEFLPLAKELFGMAKKLISDNEHEHAERWLKQVANWFRTSWEWKYLLRVCIFYNMFFKSQNQHNWEGIKGVFIELEQRAPKRWSTPSYLFLAYLYFKNSNSSGLHSVLRSAQKYQFTFKKFPTTQYLLEEKAFSDFIRSEYKVFTQEK